MDIGVSRDSRPGAVRGKALLAGSGFFGVLFMLLAVGSTQADSVENSGGSLEVAPRDVGSSQVGNQSEQLKVKIAELDALLAEK